MKRGTITITLKQGRREEVACYILDHATGLAVTPEQATVGGWTLTHTHTGLALPVRFHQAVDAARFAHLCAKEANWDQSAPDRHGGKEAFVNAVKIMRKIVGLYFEGHSYGREPGPCEDTVPRWYTTTTHLA